MAFQILLHVYIFLGLEAYNMSLLTGTSVPIVDILDPVLFYYSLIFYISILMYVITFRSHRNGLLDTNLVIPLLL